MAEYRRKIIGVPLEKSMTTDDQGFLRVRGRFTSDSKDMAGDIITRRATEKAIPAYRQWMNVRRMHLPEPVGKVTRIGTADGLDWNEVEIKVIDPKAVFEVQNELLPALSVGILVDMSKVRQLEDGGWEINEYALAEISLVDHPANYDAALEMTFSLDDVTRNKMREEGIVPVLRSMGAVSAQKGTDMEEDQKDIPVEEPVAEAAPVVDEAQVEAPVAEVEKAVEVEEEEQPIGQPAEEEAPTQEEATAQAESNPIAEALAQLNLAISALIEKVDGLARVEHPAPEADVESDETVTKGIGGEDERVAQLEKQLADLQSQVAVLATPVERKGALPVEAVEEEPTEAEEEVVVNQPKNLSDAVRKFMESRPVRR